MEQGIISINALKFYAYHGCLAEESVIGGNYLVDLNIFTNYTRAAEEDELAYTVDYCDVYEIVRKQMMIRSKLIENVAWRIAKSLKEEITSIERVEVRVTKIAPPVNGDMPGVSVTCVL